MAMNVPILGGPFHGGTIEAPRRTTAGLIVALDAGGVGADYRLASLDGRITAVLADLVEATPPYALRSVIDERWEQELRSAAERADGSTAGERERAKDLT